MSNVRVHLDNGILTLELTRADKKNALTRDMYQALADAINDVADDDTVKVILLKGDGDCFTAGNDIADFAVGQGDNAQVGETAAFMRALAHTKKVVVAQVHGMAVGIGTTLLLHCDFVYCAADTRFVLPFINLGLVPEYASSYLLPRLAGHRKAAEWLMLGEPFDAAEAAHFGLVTQVCEAQSLAVTVNAVCEKLVAKPAYSLIHTKALMKMDGDAVQQQMDEELDVFIEAMGTEAAQEAFDAFLHKRPINPEKFN